MRHAEARLARRSILMPDDVQQLKVEIAVLGNKLENLSHDVKGLILTIQALVTRREWDDRKQWSDQILTDHGNRLTRVEKAQNLIFQGFAVGGAIVFGGAYALLRGKIGLP